MGVPWLGALVAVGLSVPLVDQVFLRWLDAPSQHHAEAMEALLLRTGIVVVGWIAVDVYDALVRGGDRDVLGIWPIDPATTVRFELLRLARARVPWIAAVAVLLGPIAAVDPILWALGVAHSVGIGVLAIAASAVGILLAVRLAEAPAARPWLDLVRGNNHPAQAAFLYAPGAVLLGCGAFIQAAAVGVTWVRAGDPLGVLLLAAPLPAAVACGTAVPGLARGTWFQAGSVMAEVDARYALIEDRTEALRVYLDWAVRFLPASVGLWALKDLRHGWRVRRTWLVGAWLVGLAALVAAWTRDPSGPGRAAAIATLGCWAVGSVGVLLERDEPEFLRAWLPPGGMARWGGRAAAVGLWVQPVVWLGALGAAARQGLGAGALVLGAGELTAALAAGAVVLCGERGGLALYGPIAALGAAVVGLGVFR